MKSQGDEKSPGFFFPNFEVEKSMGFGPNFDYVIGVDEVGRGCLAGPVVAGAALWSVPQSESIPEVLLGIKDSKLLSESERERLSPLIQNFVIHSVQEASVNEIDSINILRASHVAMVRAIESCLAAGNAKIKGFHQERVLVLIDGNMIPRGLQALTAHCVVKGDQKSMAIASASVIAKVYRDQLMLTLHEKFPVYGLAKHKGYPTPAHKKAIREFGICEIHRKSFSI